MKGGATYRARKLGLESWKEAYTYTPEALETYLGKKVYTPKQFEYLNAYMGKETSSILLCSHDRHANTIQVQFPIVFKLVPVL